MTEELVARHNAIVTDADDVWHLGKMINVGVDQWAYAPVSVEQLVAATRTPGSTSSATWPAR